MPCALQVLKGLAAAALPTSGVAGSTHPYYSALPLWGIGMPESARLPVNASAPQLVLDSVTLLLPRQDYAALLCTALCVGKHGPSAWQHGNSTSSYPLLRGITVFEVAASAAQLGGQVGCLLLRVCVCVCAYSAALCGVCATGSAGGCSSEGIARGRGTLSVCVRGGVVGVEGSSKQPWMPCFPNVISTCTATQSSHD